MPSLLTIPNEILDEIASHLDPVSTFYLLLTCRSLRRRVGPAMLLHAVAPKWDIPALQWAARQGHLPLVQYLLTVMDVDLHETDGTTALHEAAWACDLPIVEELLRHSPVVNRPNHIGWTAISGVCAIKNDDHAAVEATLRILLAHGAEVHSDAANVSLEPTVRNGSVRIARLLLQSGACPKRLGPDNIPPIVSAAQSRNSRELVELLLDHGADIAATNDTYSNATMMAAKRGNLETVMLLVDRGAELNNRDNYGNTAVTYACMYLRRDVAEFLVACEGFNIQHAVNHSAVYMTVLRGYDAALRILLERGASIDDDDQRSQSLLHTAVSRKQVAVVGTLLEFGANIETEVNEGLALLTLALDLRSAPIVNILLKYGMDRVWGSEVAVAAETRMRSWIEVSGASDGEGNLLIV